MDSAGDALWMLLDRASLIDLAHRSHQVPRLTVRAASVVVDTHETKAMDNVDSHDEGKQRRAVAAPRRDFPELITEEAEPGEEQVYGAAVELVVEWREAWAARKSARHTLASLRAERRRLELELRLIGVFGLTPPPADAPWRERRREQELGWRGRALRRLRWQLPLTWCLHGLLRLLTLGLRDRHDRRGPRRPEGRADRTVHRRLDVRALDESAPLHPQQVAGRTFRRIGAPDPLRPLRLHRRCRSGQPPNHGRRRPEHGLRRHPDRAAISGGARPDRLRALRGARPGAGRTTVPARSPGGADARGTAVRFG